MTQKSAAQKMMLKPGRSVRLINPPPNVFELLGGLPDGVTLVDNSAGAGSLLMADIIVLFAANRSELEALLPGARAALNPQGFVWVVYYKGTSRIKTDINRDSINAYAHSLGLEGIAIISINEDWSGLRLKQQIDSEKQAG